MPSYNFDLIAMAEKDKGAAQAALGQRPFQIFRFSPEVEGQIYERDERFEAAVNVSLATGRPLLLTGEPGTGKTAAANWLSQSFGAPLHRFQVRSDSLASDLRYFFDAVDYFRRAQLAAVTGSEAKPSPGDSVTPGPLWDAIEHDDPFPHVLLIDEIDKAQRDFPNDLLDELDRLEFYCREKERLVIPRSPGLRPIIVITSNSERRLPEPFLRRCIYHSLEMTSALIERIVTRRLEKSASYLFAPDELRNAALDCFLQLRSNYALQKRPSVDEFWQWLGCLVQLSETNPGTATAVVAAAKARDGLSNLPLIGTLIKLDEDMAKL